MSMRKKQIINTIKNRNSNKMIRDNIKKNKSRGASKRILKVSIAGLAIVMIIFVIVFLINSVILPQDRYKKAMNLINNKQYFKACQILADLGNYKDSREQLAKYNLNILKDAKVDDLVYWGEYEQDNVQSNGPEAIAWRVLVVKNSQLLLLADKILDVKPYNTKMEAVTWETCTLRSWLNSEFLNAAFSNREQEAICVTDVQNSDNTTYKTEGGKNTADKIFLLSIDEAKNYFLNNEQRVANETRYAQKQGEESKFYFDGWWFLRSPGFDSTMAAIICGENIVGEVGTILDDGVPVFHDDAIRPAFWINLSSLN